MSNANRGRGFTIIELLTVIAIISVLAAIIFPLAGSVREQARESDCMSNLHQLWVSAMVYKQDEGAFPPTLLGYVEVDNPAIPAADPNRYYIGASGQVPIAFDKALNSYLYRQQVKDARVFRSPNNTDPSKVSITRAHFPPKPPGWPANQAWIGDELAAAGCPTDPNDPDGTTFDCWNEVTPPLVQAGDVRYHQPKYYYSWDSYSISPRVGPDLMPVLDSLGKLIYDVHYSTDWTGTRGFNGTTSTWDMSNQLKYAEPPTDKTLFAMTTWHVVAAKSHSVTAISLAGRARKVPLDQFLRWNARSYSQ
jgi:prepilin-type N-terminal cleavage/methylation domain-containing protein